MLDVMCLCLFVQAEKLTTRDPLETRVAEQKKEGRIAEAELRKQEAREKNYAEKEAARSGGLTTGVTTGHTTGVTTGHSVDPLSSEYVESGTVGTRPVGTGTGTGTAGTGTGRTTIALKYNP